MKVNQANIISMKYGLVDLITIQDKYKLSLYVEEELVGWPILHKSPPTNTGSNLGEHNSAFVQLCVGGL